MGRSKFPGKPSKHVNRKRINVLPPNSETIPECSNLMTVETVAENKQPQNDDPDTLTAETSNPITKVSLRRKLTRKMHTSKSNASRNCLLSKFSNKSASLKITQKTSANRKPVHRYSSKFRPCRKEPTNLVGKFVLPTRSIHSSRVIKPNKRFINVDLSDTITLKKTAKRHSLKPEDKTKGPALQEKASEEFPASGRVVLRQARLKLHNQTLKPGANGPFSNNTSSAPPGTVTCGVCGAVRCYRFVKQARKFNIYSCESCRKFISKLIKRQSCGKAMVPATLVCCKGLGMCHVPPIVRNQQMKLIRCAYRSRCPACWLKMCLRSFQMPISLKNSLVQLLPEYMQGPDVMFINSLPLIWQANVQNLGKGDCLLNGSVSGTMGETNVRQRSVRLKNLKPMASSVSVLTNSDVKRQKIDLKGPRVKHVCRSASIVLGQPLATFLRDGGDKKKLEGRSCDGSELGDETQNEGKRCGMDMENMEVDLSDGELFAGDKMLSKLGMNDDGERNRPVSFLAYSSYNIFDEKEQKLVDKSNISIYGENYDMIDMDRNGFCIIASKFFSMPAICFHCGSAGRDTLLHCSLCCEPYHSFCLETPPVTYNNIQNSIWLCPRCTPCNQCNQIDRETLNCHKCLKAYHLECFNTTKLQKDVQRLLVCSKCLTCNCCNQIIPQSVGNLPLCWLCFKLKRKGCFCSICQISFDQMDVNESIMECTKCTNLIHTSCEGVSKETYNMLCSLPDLFKYKCNACSENSLPTWYTTIETELNIKFHQVLKLLSKTKLGKILFKLDTMQRKSTTNFPSHERSILEPSSLLNSNMENNNRIFIHDLKDENIGILLDVKNKINTSEFKSVREFNVEMEKLLKNFPNSEDLLQVYHIILQSVFPWFVSNQTDGNEIFKLSNICYEVNTQQSEEDICDQLGIDSRYCSLCKTIGDGLSHLESRLLYCGQNEWVHLNCALWSYNVFEHIDGSLQNIQNALVKGRLVRCSTCKQKGATVQCCYRSCSETYHFICARTAKCHFLHDRRIYCGNHELPINSSIIINPNAFNIRRTIFVELSDIKRMKNYEIEKTTVMIGSLCITNIGKINPTLSDDSEAIIPIDYVCSRLFWSTIEPRKLVSYKITTSILNGHVNNLINDKNFTVDHSLPKSIVERKLKEILSWHKDIDKKKSDTIEFEDEEEPQNGADLLSPEITDAILKELPHEILDGISVQDIFPKLMSGEDFINIDCTSKLEASILDTNDLKKSDEYLTDALNNQSHCSVTVSCKLDNTFMHVIQNRKLEFLQILQVDGNFDDTSSSECSSPTIENNESNVWFGDEPVTCERCQSTYRTQASYKRHLDTCEIISESDSELNQLDDAVADSSSKQVALTSYETYQQNEIHTQVINTQTFVSSKATTSEMPNDLISASTTLNKKIATLHQPELISNETFVTVPVNEQSTNQSYCINQNVPICVNPQITLQPVTINQSLLDLNQSPAVTIQSLPYSNNVVLNVAPQNNVLNSYVTSQMPNRLVKPVGKVVMSKNVKKAKRNRLFAKSEDETGHNNLPATTTATPSVIVQHLPNTTFLPNFVHDTFQQHQSAQNLQYVTAIATTPNASQSIVQLQSTDNNLINLMHPTTMIIQPPRVLENQLVLDSNGSLSWTTGQQIQPVYYGFETIVQNTVMQSQQFLPSTVPGMLTTNSSYSTTTQVFQTSKIEPVLDVATNSFVLLNSNQLVASNQQQSVDIAQNPQPQATLNNMLYKRDVCGNVGGFIPYQSSPVIDPELPKFVNVIQSPSSYTKANTATVNSNTNSISLPTPPFLSEQGIPTNIVTPTPKCVQQSSLPIQNRPMSRVLPMQTIKETKKLKLACDKSDLYKETMEVEKPVTLEFEKTSNNVKEAIEANSNKLQLNEPNEPLKNVFQKQAFNGNYKISNNVEKASISPTLPNLVSKHNNFKLNQENMYKISSSFSNKSQPVLVAPLKPIKSNYNAANVLPLTERKNCQEVNNKVEKKIYLDHGIKSSQSSNSSHQNDSTKSTGKTPTMLYTIETEDGFKYSSTSLADLWTKVLEAVQNARALHNMPLLPIQSPNMNRLELLGLKATGLKYLIEQLPGAAKCSKYMNNYGFSPKCAELEEELVGHSSGCARSAVNIKRNEPCDLFGWLASKHRKPVLCSDLFSRRGTSNTLPMTTRFRQLKLASKFSVGVYRSRIHRRGLFCLRDFENGEMVIEYSGEVIRSILTDKREKYYNSKGIGCYMFRIDDNLVVDATMTGNAARFINHSCDPNCYSKVVEILGHKHIIIFALRRIISGEELTYDYKFPIEEDKIPCTCDTKRCRKFLN